MKRYDYDDCQEDMFESGVGTWCKYDDHFAAIRELTDRLAIVEKERDELKRVKTCGGCVFQFRERDMEPCYYCTRGNRTDNFKPRDPSAAQGGVE